MKSASSYSSEYARFEALENRLLLSGTTTTSTESSDEESSETVVVAPATTTIEAETAQNKSGVSIDSGNGAQGGSFVNFGSTGYAEWTNISGGTNGGTYQLTFRYALREGSRTGQLTVNGATQSFTMNATGAWDTWGTKTVDVQLNAGSNNVIRLASTGQDFGNTDFLTLTAKTTTTPTDPPAENPDPVKLQAEAAPIQTGVAVNNDQNGSEGGFINFSSTGHIQWNNISGGSNGGAYDLTIRYALREGSRTGQLTVNGVTQSLTMNATGAWDVWGTKTVRINLNAGTSNVIRLASTGQDYGNTDHLTLTPVTTTTPPPSETPLQVSVAGQTRNLTGFSSYSGEDDSGSTVAVTSSGTSVRLTGDAWKKIALNYNVTSNTVLEFDVTAFDAGEILGIGLDADNNHSNGTVFQIGGTEGPLTGVNRSYNNYSGGTKSYSIDLGQFQTGSISYLTFVLDDDFNASGDATFSNIVIREKAVTPPPTDSAYTLQAEDAPIRSGVSIDNDGNGSTGSGFINFSSTGFIEWRNLSGGSNGGTYELSIRYALRDGSRTGQLTVNGQTRSLTMNGTGSWSTWGTLKVDVQLNAGTNNIIRLASTGQDYGNTDSLTFTPKTSTPPSSTLKVLSLGDSITRGVGDDTDNDGNFLEKNEQRGYRDWLQKLLLDDPLGIISNSASHDFIGNRANGLGTNGTQFPSLPPDLTSSGGTPFDDDHAGVPGARAIDLIGSDGRLRDPFNSGADLFAGQKADVILLHIGTNSINNVNVASQGYASTEQRAADHLRQLLEAMEDEFLGVNGTPKITSSTKIFVADIIPHLPTAQGQPGFADDTFFNETLAYNDLIDNVIKSSSLSQGFRNLIKTVNMEQIEIDAGLLSFISSNTGLSTSQVNAKLTDPDGDWNAHTAGRGNNTVAWADFGGTLFNDNLYVNGATDVDPDGENDNDDFGVHPTDLGYQVMAYQWYRAGFGQLA